MFEKFRFSSSILIAIIFTFISFIGMSFLISTPKYHKSTEIEMIDFSKVQDMDKPIVKEIIKKPPPEKEVTAKQSATPKLTIDSTRGRGSVEIPIRNTITKIPSELTGIDVPKINSDYILGSVDNADLTPIVMIEPRYPPKAAIAKIEGWVTVEFTVNEQGQVTHAKVLKARPASIFDSAALRAIKKSKFKALVVDGKTVAQRATQTFEFKLDKEQ